MSDFDVVPTGTIRRISEKLDYLYGVNGIDSRAYDVLRALLPESPVEPAPAYQPCGRCEGRGVIGIREICPRRHGSGRVRT